MLMLRSLADPCWGFEEAHMSRSSATASEVERIDATLNRTRRCTVACMSSPAPFIPHALAVALCTEVIEELNLAKSIGHGPESGRAREEIVRRFLRRLMPSGYGIDTGFVIDSSGHISKQIDIIIHRTGYHPVFDVAGIRHFMVESVAAVIENKSRLTSKSSLREAFENIASAKALDVTGGGTNRVVIGGNLGPLVVDHIDDVNLNILGAVITADSVTPATYLDVVVDFCQSHERRLWPSIYVAIADFAGIFMKETPSGERAITTSHSEMQYAGVTVRSLPQCVEPLRDLAQRLANVLRIFSLIDFNLIAYFPGSTGHTGARPL